MKQYQCQFFAPVEFERCMPKCSRADMSDNLLMRLDIARHLFGAPIILTSAYRSADYEKSVGRSGTSSHTKGLAVDIACIDLTKRYHLVNALLRAGFFRIGIADTYIHADIDTSKKSAIWTY